MIMDRRKKNKELQLVKLLRRYHLDKEPWAETLTLHGQMGGQGQSNIYLLPLFVERVGWGITIKKGVEKKTKKKTKQGNSR